MRFINFNMAAPMRHMGRKKGKVYFPLRSGASLVKTRPVFSFDQKWLFVCSGLVIKVYSISSGECMRELCGHRDYVTGIAIHPKNKLQLISCSLDQKIIVWDYTDGVLLREIHQDSKLHALYTIQGDNKLYLLQQNSHDKTESLPFKCCGNSYVECSSFEANQRVQRANSKLTCTTCNEAFTRNKSLKRHIKRHIQTERRECTCHTYM